MAQKVQSLDALLDKSQATAAFKEAVRQLESGGRSPLIDANAGSPPVKVLRVIMKLLEECPDWEVESVRLSGNSGCSDFRGDLSVEPGARSVAFVWDCRWRAEDLGWNDPLGFPDQIRAAREFGYQCFEKWEVL